MHRCRQIPLWNCPGVQELQYIAQIFSILGREKRGTGAGATTCSCGCSATQNQERKQEARMVVIPVAKKDPGLPSDKDLDSVCTDSKSYPGVHIEWPSRKNTDLSSNETSKEKDKT